jgi:hypothetical protein
LKRLVHVVSFGALCAVQESFRIGLEVRSSVAWKGEPINTGAVATVPSWEKSDRSGVLEKNLIRRDFPSLISGGNDAQQERETFHLWRCRANPHRETVENTLAVQSPEDPELEKLYSPTEGRPAWDPVV